MADAETSLEIVARLRDEASPGFEKLEAQIREFARLAPTGAALLTKGAEELATASLAASARIKEAADVARVAVNQQRDALKGGQTGAAQNEAAALADTLLRVEQSSEGARAKLASIGPVLEQNRAAAAQLFGLVEPGFKNVNAQVDHLVRQLERASQLQPESGRAIESRLIGTGAAITQARGVALPVQLAGAVRAPIPGLGDRDTFISEQTRKLRTDIDALAKSSAAARGELANLGSAGKEGAGGLSLLDTEIGSVTLGAAGGFGLATAAVLGFVGAVRDAAAESERLDKLLTPIAGESAAGAASLAAVKQNVRDLRAETGRSLDELGALAASAADIGRESDKEFQALIVRASDAGLGTLQQTLGRMRQIAQGFGEELNTDSFLKIGDTVKAVSEDVGVGAGKVADGVASSAAAADDYNVSLEALTVTIANATKRTGDESQAATQARQALKLLADDTSELNNVLEAHGVRVDRAALAGEGFARVSAEVARVLRDTPQLRSELPDRLATFFESQANAAEQAAAVAVKAAGTINAAADRVLATPGKQAELAKERIGELKTSLFEALVPLNQIEVETAKLFNVLSDGKSIELPPLLKLLSVPGAFADVLHKFNQIRELAKLEGPDSTIGKLGAGVEIAFAPLTFLVDLLGKANDKLKEVDAGIAGRIDTLRKASELGTTGGFDPAEHPGETAGVQFADEFNRTVDARIEFVTDGAIDRGQQRIVALIEKLSTLDVELPIPLQPVLEPEAIRAARERLLALSRIRDEDVTGDEKVQIESLTETVKTYTDALKGASDLASRASDQVTDGFTKQRRSIEQTRAEAVKLLESYRRVLPVDGVIAFVNQGAAADTKRVDQQELAKFAASANARALANASELQAVSRLAKLRGDPAQAERDEIEALRLKGETERKQIEDARTAAIEKAAGSKRLIADANAEAEAKLRSLELDERSAVLARERSREQRAAVAAQQVQALRIEGLRGIEAEIAAIRAKGEEERRIASEKAQTDAEAAARLSEFIELSKRAEDRKVTETRADSELAIQLQILEAERAAAVTLEEQHRLELAILGVQQQRAALALKRDGVPNSVQTVQATADEFAKNAVAARQQVERIFGPGARIDIVLGTRVEVDRARTAAELRKKVDEAIIDAEKDLAAIPVGVDTKEAEARLDALKRKALKLKLEGRGDFSTALGDRLLDNFDELTDPTINGLKLADSLTNNLHDSVRSLLGDLVNGKASVKDFFDEFLRGVQNSLLDSLSDELTGLIGTGVGSLFGGGGSGGVINAIAGGSGGETSGIFARGGIMTKDGPVPLRQYAGGGVANSPQLALFGEGSVPEAYVPVPSGRIPVEIRGGERRENSSSSRVVREQPIVVHMGGIKFDMQINATDPQTFQEQLAVHMDDIADGIAAKVESASHSGVRNAIRRVPR